MRRVLHKGLFIVGVVLALEVSFIGALTLLLMASDREHTAEAVHRDKAVCSAHMMFGDVDAGVALIRAWRLRDPSALDFLQGSLRRAVDADRSIVKLNDEFQQKWATNDYQPKAMQCQRQAVVLLNKIGEVSSQGFSLTNLQNVWTLQKRLNTVLKETFQLLTNWQHQTQLRMEENSSNLRFLMALQVMTAAAGFVIQVLVAFLLSGFFTKHFIHTIETLRMNVDRMSHKLPLGTALQDKDEIADLDRSFRQMYDELALAGAREQALFDNATDVICVLHENFEVEKINSASSRFWGYEPDALIGASISRILATQNWNKLRTALEGARGENPACSFECDVQKRSGETVRCLWSVFWCDQNRCYFCVAHDVTEQHRFEQAREAFLAAIARDLQQPLQRIQGLFEKLAGKESFSSFATEKMENSLATLRRLTALVSELLDFERLHTGDLQLDASKQNVADALRASVRDVESLAQSKGVAVNLECDRDLVAEFDQAKVVRVVVNLLSNALKFSPKGGAVLVKAFSDSEQLLVEINDQGPGISAQAIANLFKPFKQVNAADGKRGVGTGLGLVICKQLVELHGGEIGVDSKEGAGSKFWFRLPLSQSARDTSAVVPVEVAEVEEASAVSVPVRVRSEQPASFMEKLGLKRVRLLLIGLPLGFEVIFVGLLALLLWQANVERAKEIRERDLILCSVHLCLGYAETAISVVGSGGMMHGKEIEHALSTIPQRAAELDHLANSSDAETRSLVHNILSVNAELEPMARNAASRVMNMGGFYDPHLTAGVHDRLIILCSRMQQPVISFLDKHSGMASDALRHNPIRQQQACLLAAGLAFNTIFGLGAAMLFSRSIARRLNLMGENCRRLARSEALLPLVAGSDEIAELDASFHDMAGRLTEQRKKERAYLDNSRDVIGSFDEHFLLTQASVAAESLIGSRSIVGVNVFELFAEDDRKTFEVTADELRASDAREARQIEVEMCADSPTRFMLWSVSWSSSERCYFFVAHDISKRKELQRMEREFIAVVSHDLRTPLATIFGTTELLRQGVLGEISEDAKTTLSDVNQHVNRMLDLINDLLDLEKLNAGQMQLSSAEISFTDLSAKIVAQSARNLEERQQPLTVIPSEATLFVDSDRLSQAITNIIGELSSLLRAETCFSLSVKDDALVLSASNIGQHTGIVESLQQGLLSTSTSLAALAGTTRLRLPLARNIVVAHNGSITVSDSGDLTVSIIGIPMMCSQVQPTKTL